jgi:hypothetical protein
MDLQQDLPQANRLLTMRLIEGVAQAKFGYLPLL